eukprot:TRINITY_DN7540_c0_g1_i2.p1 TRINITY_DN7540_c0_g1~~TRINITY_DN7540_c0_g1_i2.p1  ORF type:complete len:234 (-),score=43.84 TRINITY_DN7540_c0_g1_i2:14-715(-)
MGPGSRVTRCPSCGGTGEVTQRISIMFVRSPCRACGGVGQFISNPCRPCNGHGTVEIQKEANFKIPAGVETGHVLLGQRRTDPSLRIRVEPHPHFQRKGNDIHLYVPLTLHQALLGGAITVPTITTPVELRIPEGVQPDDNSILRGRGVKDVHIGKYGDMFVHYKVQLPRKLNNIQRDLIKQFARESGFKDIDDEPSGADQSSATSSSSPQVEKKEGLLAKVTGFIGSLFGRK